MQICTLKIRWTLRQNHYEEYCIWEEWLNDNGWMYLCIRSRLLLGHDIIYHSKHTSSLGQIKHTELVRKIYRFDFLVNESALGQEYTLISKVYSLGYVYLHHNQEIDSKFAVSVIFEYFSALVPVRKKYSFKSVAFAIRAWSCWHLLLTYDITFPRFGHNLLQHRQTVMQRGTSCAICRDHEVSCPWNAIPYPPTRSTV